MVSLKTQFAATQDFVQALKHDIGAENVAFDDITRLLYSTDASNYQIVPMGVTFPRHPDDVCAIHELAARYAMPVLPRGSGTSLAGQSVGQAVIIDFTRHLRRVRSINAETRTVQVETGLVHEHLNRQLQPLGLMFGPDPASANRATLGGCLANNSTGTHSILYRMTADHVRGLEVVLASGEKVSFGLNAAENSTTAALKARVRDILIRYADPIATRYPKTWRNVAGYALNRLNPDSIDLAQLIVGSEGTLGSIVSAEIALVERPRMTRLAIVHFDELRASLEIVPALIETSPSAIELLDKSLLDRTRRQIEFARRLTFVEGDPLALLVIEYYGDSEDELTAKIQNLEQCLTRQGHRGAVVVLSKLSDQADVWAVRKAGLGLLASIRGDAKPVALIEDAAVPVEHLAAYISRVDDIIRSEGAEMSIYAHASAGCLHVRPALNLKSGEGLRQYRAIAERTLAVILEFGGTTSSEHGEGLIRGEFSQRLFGAELTQAFREVKQLFDPQNRLNPNKVINLPPLDDPAILRYGPRYRVPLEIKQPYFDWSADYGFAGAVEMCNGAGVCRKEDSGTMCPSFMATRNEYDSTRARANILRLAMTGALGLDGMAHEKVKSVLDLCLSCKACKAECPSAVDMARIKAEFMATYRDKNGLPWQEWLFGNIHRLNRVGSLMPRFVKLAMSFPLLSAWVKRCLGIDQRRVLPRLARQRFSRWAGKRSMKSEVEESAIQETNAPILLIDTFTEFNHPEIGEALYYLHRQLNLPFRALRFSGSGCCGRPALSKGMLAQAKKMAGINVQFLTRVLAQEPSTRFMMLEPSCVSALRDDYPGLVEKTFQTQAYEIARRTLSVEEWLDECRGAGFMDKLPWDHQAREVILHGHCHQKALWGTSAALRLLKSIPEARVTELDAGCCGMAGSFGYQEYDVSMQIAEKRLYPTVRQYPQAIIAAAGTSCREQVSHIQGNARHPVEILAMACGWIWKKS